MPFDVDEHDGALPRPRSSSIAISDEFSGIFHSRIIMEDSAKVTLNDGPRAVAELQIFLNIDRVAT